MFQSPILAENAPPVTPTAFRQHMLLETGHGYASFRKTLTPRYGRVLADIGLGYAALLCLLALVGQASGIAGGLIAATAGAIGVGYAIAYLQLFIHEAAHYNLAATKRRNDRLADWLICWQVGTSIAAYRATHGAHHRHLGDERDTEVSYRHPLTARFVAEMLTGLHALRVFSARKGGTPKSASKLPLLRGLTLHGLLLATLVALGAWPAALAWCGGIAVAYPFFATIRQLLEHRPSQENAGEGHATNRLFGDSLLARSFGGAGFNRHLLHHLEPQVSYTRLEELEEYLMTTSLRDHLDARRATYLGTFAELLGERAK